MRYAILSVKTSTIGNGPKELKVTEPAEPGRSEMVDRHFRVIMSGDKIIITLKTEKGEEILVDELYAAEHYNLMRVATVPAGQPASAETGEQVSTDRERFPDISIDPELILIRHLNQLGRDGWKIEHIETFNRIVGARTVWVERCYTLSMSTDGGSK